MQAVLDTNILIDYLNGYSDAEKEIGQYDKPLLSIISKMEILVGTSEQDEDIIRDFLDRFYVVPICDKVAELAVQIRKEHKIKLPDAIIWATARANEVSLVTRNIKDFASSPDVRIPYMI